MAVRVTLDMAWALSAEVEHRGRPAARLTTSAMLFALCDLARTESCPSSKTLQVLREHMSGRWQALATARGQYLCGLRYQEAPISGASSMSEPALRVLRLARLLAQEPDEGLVRVRHLLTSLLLTPALPEPSGAHHLLRDLQVCVETLRDRCPG